MSFSCGLYRCNSVTPSTSEEMSPEDWHAVVDESGIASGFENALPFIVNTGVPPHMRLLIWPVLLGVYSRECSRVEQENMRNSWWYEYWNMQYRKTAHRLEIHNEFHICGGSEPWHLTLKRIETDARRTDPLSEFYRRTTPPPPGLSSSLSPSLPSSCTSSSAQQPAQTATTSTTSAATTTSDQDRVTPPPPNESDHINSDHQLVDQPSENSVTSRNAAVSPMSKEAIAEGHCGRGSPSPSRLPPIGTVGGPNCGMNGTLPTPTSTQLYYHEQHIASLERILIAYALLDPPVGYCQGMADLASVFLQLTMKDVPIPENESNALSAADFDHLATLRREAEPDHAHYRAEVEAFTLFHALMQSRMRDNFLTSGQGMQKQFGELDVLLQLTDAKLHAHLSQVVDHVYAFRSLLLHFRRELDHDSCCRFWEMLWALEILEKRRFHLHAVVGVLHQHRSEIMQKRNTLELMLRMFNELPGKLHARELMLGVELVIELENKSKKSMMFRSLIDRLKNKDSERILRIEGTKKT